MHRCVSRILNPLVVDMTSQETLVLFTESYPFASAAEDSFIEPELEAYQREFSRVIIVPAQTIGERTSVSGNASVNEKFASYLSSRRRNMNSIFYYAARALLSPLFWQELFRNPILLLQPKSIVKVLRHVVSARMTRDWVERSFLKNFPPGDNLIILSYWFTSITTGLAWLRNTSRRVVIGSRAHGADVYLERQDVKIFPCREWTLQRLTGVFFTSTDARQYTNNHFPGHETILHVAPLGIPDPGWRSSPSSDTNLRIVSCSAIIPVKRIELMAQGIAEFAKLTPDQSITWHHIGDGPLRSPIVSWCRDHMPKNVKWEFAGSLRNADVMLFYKTHEVDLFLNMSASEGGRPVAMMEALSCGIPVMGPTQGGMAEMITTANGFLLSPNPTPEEISHSLIQAFEDRQRLKTMRQTARTSWEQNYDAKKNAGSFARALIQLSHTA